MAQRAKQRSAARVVSELNVVQSNLFGAEALSGEGFTTEINMKPGEMQRGIRKPESQEGSCDENSPIQNLRFSD